VRLGVVSAVVILLFAGGVYWLRHQPTRLSSSEGGTTIQVRLLPAPDPAPLPLTAAEVTTSGPADSEASQPSPDSVDEVDREDLSTSPSIAKFRPSSSPAVKMSPTSSRRAAPDVAFRFQQALLRHIARFQHYPALARAKGLEGTVQILFLLRRDGSIADAWIETTSGQIVLDEEAIATVRRSEPLPAIPAELPDELRVLLPVAFAP
jgi:periplasmic protein TonB